MKILIISPWCDDIDLKSCKGTPENAYLFEELLNKKHEIFLLCQGDAVPERIKKSISFKTLPPFPFVKPSKLNYLTFPIFHHFYERRMRRIVEDIINSWKPEIIYNIAGYGHPEILKLSKEHKIPYCVKTMGTIHFCEMLHSTLGKLIYFKEHLVFKHKANHYFIVDDGTNTLRVAKSYFVDESNITILPNPKPDSRAEKIPHQEFKVGYFSRFDKLKGTDLFLEIASKVLEKDSKTKFLIAGDGPYAELINKLQFKFPKNVNYLGFLPYLELQPRYGEIDLLLSTNRYSNLTLNTIEALHNGVPVIAFDTQETKRLVIDNFSGFLIPPFNVDMAASKIIQLKNDNMLLEKLREGAMKVVEKLPTWSSRAKFEVEKLEEIANEVY